MQMMPKISWPQRVASDADGRTEARIGVVIVGSSLFCRLFFSASSWRGVGRFTLLADKSHCQIGELAIVNVEVKCQLREEAFNA
jgi:hypothetical protein